MGHLREAGSEVQMVMECVNLPLKKGKGPSSTVSPSSSRPGMVSTRSPGWRNSLYSNVPANRGAWGQKIPAVSPAQMGALSARQQAAALSETRGAKRPLPPLSGAAGQLFEPRDSVKWSAVVPVGVSRQECEVGTPPGPPLALCSQTRVAPASCRPCPAALQTGLHILVSLAWRSGWGSRGRAVGLGCPGGDEASYWKSVRMVGAGLSLLGRLQGAV